MIYKYTGQLLADRLGQQNCCNRRIHTAGKCTQYLAVSNLFTDLVDRCLHERIHLPITCASTDIIYEIGKHLSAFLSMHNLRMELYCIQLLLCIFHSCNRTHWCMGCNFEFLRCFFNIIGMTHPTDRAGGYIFK